MPMRLIRCLSIRCDEPLPGRLVLIELQPIPILLSLLVLGAHFLRSGTLVSVGLVLGLLRLLVVRRPWAARALQAVLVLEAVEWMRTLFELEAWRIQTGQLVKRLVVLLVSVAILTGLWALVMGSTRLRGWCWIGQR